MSKYLVFGWSQEADKQGPADEFLGTSSVLMDEYEAGPYLEGEGQQFGIKLVERKVTTTDNILQGAERDMLVAVNYSYYGGVEAGRPIVAYMEIKEREPVDG